MMHLDPSVRWNEGKAPQADVVLSCRARVARNIAGFPFTNCASDAQCNELLGLVRNVLLNSKVVEEMIWVDLCKATPHDRRLLFERHLISKQHMESDTRRAVAVSGDESLSVMVNEEDHLRMQVLAPGLQFGPVFERVNQLDNAVEQRLDFACAHRWGYLTACPTNVGTGIRFSAMMHLPALRITNEIDRVRRAAKDLHLAVRGYYGEGSESAGDCYQVSNQVTLGRSETELLEEFEQATLPKLIEYERQARQVLLKRNPTLLDDRTHRALALMRSARLLGAEEAMKLLSRVRLGVHLGRLEDIDSDLLNRLFLQIQPAHLQQQTGVDDDAEALRAARAALVRRTLS